MAKICTVCKEDKSLVEFQVKRSNKTDGLTSGCKACLSIARAVSYQRNKSKQDVYNREYAKKNTSSVRATKNRWKSGNIGKVRADTAKRRANKLSATPKWFEKDKVAQLYKISDFLTKSSFGDNFHVDHIIPLQSSLVCGLHCLDNLRVISANENLSKGNRYEG